MEWIRDLRGKLHITEIESHCKVFIEIESGWSLLFRLMHFLKLRHLIRFWLKCGTGYTLQNVACSCDFCWWTVNYACYIYSAIIIVIVIFKFTRLRSLNRTTDINIHCKYQRVETVLMAKNSDLKNCMKVIRSRNLKY